MTLDAKQMNELLESVAGKMRELGVQRFEFEGCSIELGERPVSADRMEEERIQRIRDAQEINSMEREERRRYAASARIGPKPRHIT